MMAPRSCQWCGAEASVLVLVEPKVVRVEKKQRPASWWMCRACRRRVNGVES